MRKLIVLLLASTCLTLAIPPAVRATGQQTAKTAVHQININTATAEELQMLPGIGKVTAGEIVQYRTEHGKFTSPEDLVKVKGVGTKTVGKIRGMIVVQ